MTGKKKGSRKKKCRHCPNKAYSRECCADCYGYGRNLVRTRQKTDEQLVDEGFFAPKKPLGRPAKSGLGKKIKKLATAKK